MSLSALHAYATTATPGGVQFYGNVTAVGSGSCSEINGTFPTNASLDTVTNSSGTFNRYYLKFIIPNPAVTGEINYLTAVFSALGTETFVYDPQLFETTDPVTGNYSGTITQGTVPTGANSTQTTLLVGASESDPLELVSSTCTITFYGTLYLTPD
jgi:hypothetical protein